MRRSVFLLALLFISLLGATAAMPLLEQAPSLRSQNAAKQFDAVRAKAQLAYVLADQQPHPSDSASGDAVRGRLLAALRHIGLNPIVRDQFSCNELYKQRGISCARVHNIVAILGPASGKALLINAHYDSTPVGPGAADDGIGVATLLEVGRLLKNRTLRRPVMLLFNEGEELGLVGARAFLADPLSNDVDSLINLEARGVRGPVNMFETSRPNETPIELFARAVKHPTANSLSTDVYRLMPNYTDVNSFSERGWMTLNLAPIGNETRYHSPGDDVAALDPATLQHMGDQTLALATRLADGTPERSTSNRIFMDLAGRTLITLPLAVGVVLLAALLLSFAGLTLARGAGLASAALVVGTLAGSSALAWAASTLIGAFRQGMFWRAHPSWTHLATYAGVLLVGAALIATLGRAISIRQLRAGFWLVFLIIGMMVGLFAPGGIVFFLFPPLLVLVGIGLARWWRPAEQISSVAAILFLYFTWGAMLGLLQELLNGGPMWIFAPLAGLLLLPALTEFKGLIQAAELPAVAGLAGVLTFASWTAAAAAPAYSADRQQRFVIQHIADASTGKAWWSILNDRAPLPAAFGDDWTLGKLPISDSRRWFVPAKPDPTAKSPAVQILSQVRNGDERTLTLRISANGADEIDMIAPENSKIRSAGAVGFARPIDQNEDGKYYIGCSGRSCDGATIELTTDHSNAIRFLVVGTRATLPRSAASLLRARPKWARPQYNPDSTISYSHVSL